MVVTRPAAQAGPLRRAFEAEGAQVVSLPLLTVAPPEDPGPLEEAAKRLGDFDWILFPSTNALEALLGKASLPPSARLAAIGGATGKALESRGRTPDLIPSRQEATGLVQELLPRLRAADRVLLPQADDARATLEEGLRDHCRLTVATAYRKSLPAEAAALARRHLAEDPIGWVTFTSPRIVRHLVELLGSAWSSRRDGLEAASIGPVTSAALRRQGVEPEAEAAEPSVAALVEAVGAVAGARRT